MRRLMTDLFYTLRLPLAVIALTAFMFGVRDARTEPEPNQPTASAARTAG